MDENIQKLEKEALQDKPWQLRGEISAKIRPENSLLEEYLEFDVTTRPGRLNIASSFLLNFVALS